MISRISHGARVRVFLGPDIAAYNIYACFGYSMPMWLLSSPLRHALYVKAESSRCKRSLMISAD